MAKVSIIVPIYNAEKYIDTCIESLINQTLKDIEIILVNDGSKDKTQSIIEQYAESDRRIKIINQINSGPGAARNRGLEISTGEYIKFVDADDYLTLNILDKMYETAKQNNVSLVRGNNKTIIGPFKGNDACSWSGIKESKIIIPKKEQNYIITETPMIGNKLIKRDLIDDIRFPEQKQKWEDLAVIPVLIAKSQKLFHMNEPVYNYRINMNTTIKDFIYEIPSILDIVRSLETIEQLMKKYNLYDEYYNEIKSLFILHTLFRVENAMTWINSTRKVKETVINSLINILEIKYPDWKDDNIIEKYMQVNPLFKFDMKRLDKYTRNYIQLKSQEEAENQIKKAMKNKVYTIGRS